ncbi:MAG: hypothetical protein S4CHLAM6_10360 [Chlamydiae bacterium]|nr:hypothetical protein [Chlamydiota bacterium]
MVNPISDNNISQLRASADDMLRNDEKNKKKNTLENHIIKQLEIILDAAVNHHANAGAAGAHGATGIAGSSGIGK